MSLLRTILHFCGEGCETGAEWGDEGKGRAAEVVGSTWDVWSAVVDSAGDAESVGWIGEFDIGTEGKGAMGAG
jgi:hypothetical protein